MGSASERDVGMAIGLVRSVLFVPALDGRKWAKALAGEADAVILDLEDSVAPGEKARARASVAESVVERVNPGPMVFVRVNDLGTAWAAEDVAAVEASGADGLVLPKADGGSIAGLPAEGLPVMAIIETAEGLRTVDAVARHPRVRALLLGGADLANELGLEYRADGMELLYARSHVVVASAAAGLGAPVDVVHLDVRAESALRQECRLGRSLGMGGKMCIHPGQVDAVNEEFSPSPAEVDQARAVVAAYDAADAAGSGVTVLDGRMIDRPVVLRAQRTLARVASRDLQHSPN